MTGHKRSGGDIASCPAGDPIEGSGCVGILAEQTGGILRGGNGRDVGSSTEGGGCAAVIMVNSTSASWESACSDMRTPLSAKTHMTKVRQVLSCDLTAASGAPFFRDDTLAPMLRMIWLESSVRDVRSASFNVLLLAPGRSFQTRPLPCC